MSTTRRRSPSWSVSGHPQYDPTEEPALPHNLDHGDRSASSPNIMNNGMGSVQNSPGSQASNQGRSASPIGGQEQYMMQEETYLHRLRSGMADDYQQDPVSRDEIDDELERLSISGEDHSNLDDVNQAASLQSDDLILALDPNSEEDAEKIKERAEWQMMLNSVLTGEIFTSEKSRLENANTLNDEERWFELKAKVTNRSINEQRRLLAVNRPMTHEIIEQIMNFKLERTYDTVYEPFEKVGHLLYLLELCEQMWPNLKAMREYFPVYASDAFQTRIDILTSWHSVTNSVLQELELLRKWTGNSEVDPTKRPDPGAADEDNGDQSKKGDSNKSHFSAAEGKLSLVNLNMKQEGTLVSTFHRHIFPCMLPLLQRVRSCTLEYSSVFVELGLPHFLLGLSPIVSFPVKILRESIKVQLNATRLLQNPTALMIDEEIGKLKIYMKLGLQLTEGYVKLTEPVLDKGWIFNRNDTSINDVMLSCIKRYLDLLRKKYVEGGRSSMSFFHSFESIEDLEIHFAFLQDTCQLIDGGDSSVAEQFTRLHSRVLSRLLSYWEHQMKGPAHFTKNELDRWFPSTIENIRSIQRKLLRFYKTLANTYENAADFNFSITEISQYLDQLREGRLFLVIGTSSDMQGCYAFATENLRNKPLVIRNLLQGHARPPPHGEPAGAIVLVSLSEALRWDGDSYQLDIGKDNLPKFEGQVRIIAQGGYRELQSIEEHLIPNFKDSRVIEARRSHHEKVDFELHNMRKITAKLAKTVVESAIQFRQRVRNFDCQDTVQAMFSFAREFGQRGLPLVSDANRSFIILKLVDLCVAWVEFVSDDCTPSEKRTFKWTVQALEFAMMITRGMNILAIGEEQFANLRRKVADCVTLLISHFDIMGARSKAANLTHHTNRTKLLQDSLVRNYDNTLVDNDKVMEASRAMALEKLRILEDKLTAKYNHGKVLDQNNTLIEFLSFAASRLMSTSTMRWQRDEIIGSGGSGNVFKARNLDTFQLMAAKEVRITASASKVRNVLANIQHEMTALEMVSHPNIVQYYGAELHRDRIFIFMEYCPQGSLTRVFGQDGRIEDELVVQLLALQILEGLAYLHQSGIVHRDIKPENILIKGDVVKIVDFGAAKIIADPHITAAQTKLDLVHGTPMYMAPEVIKNDRSAILASVDIWSFGCVILRMITGRLPWSDIDNVFSIMYYIGSNKNPEIPGPDVVSPGCHDVLKQTLQFDPQKRPTSLELLRHPWFFQARDNLKILINQQRIVIPEYGQMMNPDPMQQQQQQQQQSEDISPQTEGTSDKMVNLSPVTNTVNESLNHTSNPAATTNVASVPMTEKDTNTVIEPEHTHHLHTVNSGSSMDTQPVSPNHMGKIVESDYEYENGQEYK